MSTTNPFGDGWTCNKCGTYVPSGVTHSCTNTQWTPQPYPGTSQPYDPPVVKIDPFFVYERIATALERIAAALEEKKTPDFIAKTQGTPGWK
jgi:hypothetical protein